MTGSSPPIGRWSSDLLQLLRGSAFIFACRIAGAGLTLLVQLVLARAIGAAGLGVYALAFSWCVLLANASTLGFMPAAVRFVGEGRAQGAAGDVRAFVRFAIGTTLLTGIAVAAAGIASVTEFLPADTDRDAMRIAFAVVPVLAVLHLVGGIVNGFGRFALGFLPTSLFRPFIFLCLVAVLWTQGYAMDAATAMLLNAAAIVVVVIPAFVLSWTRVAREDPGKGVPARRREWLGTSLSLMIGALFTGYFPDLIVILAGFHLPSHELAVLHVCLRVATLVTFALFAVDTFAGPQIAYEYAGGRMEALQRIVDRATRLRFCVAIAATAAFVALGRPMLALFGDEFVTGYPLLIILGCGQLVQGAVGPVVRLMGVSEHQHRCVPVFVACFVITIVLVAALAPQFGAEGVAVAAAFVMAVWAVALRYLTVRFVGIRPRIL